MPSKWRSGLSLNPGGLRGVGTLRAALICSSMARAIWRGAINFGLVAIPVKLVAAVRPDELGLHFLHANDRGRIHNERVCEVCGKQVEWSDIVRGYEYEKDQFVVLADDDLKKASPRATQSVDIVQFAPGAQIDSILFGTPYYLEPEKRGRHAYVLLRDVLRQSGTIGITRVVLRTREHLAALRPEGALLLLQLMHWAHEIVEAKTWTDRPSEALCLRQK